MDDQDVSRETSNELVTFVRETYSTQVDPRSPFHQITWMTQTAWYPVYDDEGNMMDEQKRTEMLIGVFTWNNHSFYVQKIAPDKATLKPVVYAQVVMQMIPEMLCDLAMTIKEYATYFLGVGEALYREGSK